MKKYKVNKNTIKRALRTFMQAALAYIVINLPLVDFTSGKEILKTAIIGLLVSSLSSGLAALMNLEKKEEVDEVDEDFTYWQ